MKITKSSRHSKITGNFSENLVLYWLSKYGFECATVDHIGIDIIARNPHTEEVMGISVKSRSRKEGTEGTYLGINNDNFDKIEKACKSFNCIPYFAIVVDEKDKIYGFILSMDKLLKLSPKGKKISAWKMTKKHIKSYYKDPKIKVFEFQHKTSTWWER
jgi:Holliday junction resolvase-like predicted endonuclease